MRLHSEHEGLSYPIVPEGPARFLSHPDEAVIVYAGSSSEPETYVPTIKVPMIKGKFPVKVVFSLGRVTLSPANQGGTSVPSDKVESSVHKQAYPLPRPMDFGDPPIPVLHARRRPASQELREIPAKVAIVGICMLTAVILKTGLIRLFWWRSSA